MTKYPNAKEKPSRKTRKGMRTSIWLANVKSAKKYAKRKAQLAASLAA
jgi:hypothetical protein